MYFLRLSFEKKWKYGAGTGLVKRGGWPALLLFNFLQGLQLETILLFAKLCYAFEEKIFFSATIA